jgi:hypothetical protein
MFDILIHLGAFEQRFGGNAAPVEADATKAFFFYNGCFKTKLGCTDSSYISAGAASDNHYIVCHNLLQI